MCRTLLSIPLVILTIILAACSMDAKITPEDPEGASIEWEKVSQAVAELLASFDPPVSHRLDNEVRIDWEKCANRPGDATQNMMGSISITGKKPLLALLPDDSGKQPATVSDYLHRNQTEWWYWIDRWGNVHLVIRD